MGTSGHTFRARPRRWTGGVLAQRLARLSKTRGAAEVNHESRLRTPGLPTYAQVHGRRKVHRTTGRR